MLGLTIRGYAQGGLNANSVVIAVAECPIVRDVKVYKYNAHGGGVTFINTWLGIIDNCIVDNSNTYYTDVSEAHVPDNHFRLSSCWHTTIKNCGSENGGQTFDVSYGTYVFTAAPQFYSIRSPSIYTTIDSCHVVSAMDNLKCFGVGLNYSWIRSRRFKC